LYKILSRQDLAPNIHQFKIEAPAIARKAQPGQFVIVRVDEKGERIPLTIADWDRAEGSITVVFHAIGKTTQFGTVVCVVGGYSVATIVPVARALKEKGNKIISIIRSPTRETLFGDERLGSFSDRVMVVTGNFSYDCDGFIIEPLRELLEAENIDLVITVGPTCVMRLVAATTRPFGVKTIASLNPIMVDGTGMCGVCRVVVSGETRFACVDGPEFDAHEVDWVTLMARRCTYSGDMQSKLHYQCRNCAQW